MSSTDCEAFTRSTLRFFISLVASLGIMFSTEAATEIILDLALGLDSLALRGEDGILFCLDVECVGCTEFGRHVTCIEFVEEPLFGGTLLDTAFGFANLTEFGSCCFVFCFPTTISTVVSVLVISCFLGVASCNFSGVCLLISAINICCENLLSVFSGEAVSSPSTFSSIDSNLPNTSSMTSFASAFIMISAAANMKFDLVSP